MTKLKTRMAGITAAAMTAAALTATAAAPAMASTENCSLAPAADVSVVHQNPGSARAQMAVSHEGETTTLRYLGGHRAGQFKIVNGSADRVDTCGNTLSTGQFFGVGAMISPIGSDLVITVRGTAELPMVTVSTVVRDTDGDGVPDADDRFPNSILGDTVLVGDQPTTVANVVSDDGASLSDLFAEALASDDAKADKKATKALIKALDEADALTDDDKKSLKSAVKDVLKTQKKAAKA